MTNALKNWSILHACTLAISSIEIFFLSSYYFFCIAGSLSFTYLLLIHAKDTQLKFPGLANAVTLLRLILLLGVAIINDTQYAGVIGFVIVACAILDVVDGWVARKLNQCTEFGSTFDIEVDAFYVALLTTLMYFNGWISVYLIPLAFLRYYYKIFITLGLRTQREFVASKIGKYLAGNLFICLIIPFFILNSVSVFWVYISHIVAGFSFLISLYQQIQYNSQMLNLRTENEEK